MDDPKYLTLEVAYPFNENKVAEETEELLNSMYEKGYKFIFAFSARYSSTLIFEKIPS